MKSRRDRNGITQEAFAALARVSQPAVSKAIRRGHLETLENGRLDPDDRNNAAWISQHHAGIDDRGRALVTHAGGRPKKQPTVRVRRRALLDDGEFDRIYTEITSGFERDERERTLKIVAERDDKLLRTLTEIKDLVTELGSKIDNHAGLAALEGAAYAVSDQLNEVADKFAQRLDALAPASLPATLITPAERGPIDPVLKSPYEMGFPKPSSRVAISSHARVPMAGYTSPPVEASRFDKVETKVDRVLAALEGEGEDNRAAITKLRAIIEDGFAELLDLRPGLVRLETGQLAQESATREAAEVNRQTLEAVKDLRYHLRELIRILIARAQAR